ncbi:MAG: hypothetical protein V4819_00220 [Verrucomicrobiota bacterium]
MKPPAAALICSLVAGLVVAGYSTLFHEGAAASYRLYYYTPAAMAAGSLVMERIGRRQESNGVRWLIDAAVTVLCLSRPIWGWPPASGHALFFVHALLTGSSRLTRILAILLGVITLYAKIWLWHGDPTLLPGLGCGLISGVLWRKTVGKQPT